MKDYYKIMNVPYDASSEDIRSAYRSFAKKYHPDKSGGRADTLLFLDIQEAYQILSDDERRRNFHAKTSYPLPGRRNSTKTSTEAILHQCRLLNTNIQNTGRYRIQPSFIAQTIQTLLSEKNITILLSEKKSPLLNEIVGEILSIMKVLPYRFVVINSSKLLRMASHNQMLQEQIIAFGNRKRRYRFWEKYNLVIILGATLLLCMLIVFLSD